MRRHLAKQAVCLIKPARDDRHGTTDVAATSAGNPPLPNGPKTSNATWTAWAACRTLWSSTRSTSISRSSTSATGSPFGYPRDRRRTRPDALGRPFGPLPLLLAHAEYVTKLHAICSRTGRPAHFSHRIEGGDDHVQIGGSESYEALSREPYNDVVVREHHRDEA